MPKPAVLRESANRDTRSAVEYYKQEAGAVLAEQFVAALQTCLTKIADQPGVGSPRYGHELDLPGLRSARLPKFPYLVMYVERDDRIDVWRILPAKRDVPAWVVVD